MPSSTAGGLLVSALACALLGCYQLDPFLYSRQRVDTYVFEPQGTSELTTVEPERIEPLTLSTADGLTLGAVYVRARAQPPRAYVLYFHGNGGSLSRHFNYPKLLSNLGYDVLAYDYRGWGMSSDVTPTEEGLAEDSRAALAWLVRRAGGGDRIIYYGESFGGAVATQRAELDPPRVLILESTFASLEEFKTDATGMDFPVGFVAKDGWETSTRIRNVHAPLLLLHGLADDYVRPEFSEAIYRNANEPKELALVEGATHGRVVQVMGEAYVRTVNGFIGRYLPAP